MYQIQFNSSFPLNEGEARISRPVFHVPARSKYVFVHQLSNLRGSDASNVHDEEPAEHEIEFSDDEAEASHKAKFKSVHHHIYSQRLTHIRYLGQAAWLARTERTCLAGSRARPRRGCFLWLEPLCRARRVRHGFGLRRWPVASSAAAI